MFSPFIVLLYFLRRSFWGYFFKILSFLFEALSDFKKELIYQNIGQIVQNKVQYHLKCMKRYDFHFHNHNLNSLISVIFYQARIKNHLYSILLLTLMKEDIIKELQICSLHKIHQQGIIKQMFGRPTRPNIHPTISEEQQIQLLSKDFPLMKELLTAAPQLILPTIKNLSQMNEQSRKSLRKFPVIELNYFNQILLKQLKRVIEWNIDHKALYTQLNTISQFIFISIPKIYKLFLLSKIQHGLVLIEIWSFIQKKISLEGFRGQREMMEYRGEEDHIFDRRIPQIHFQNQRNSQFSANFLQSIKVINTPMMRKNKDFQIYNKRYDCLSQQEKIKYRFSLLTIASNIIDMNDQQRHFGRRGMRNNENQEHVEIINAQAERLFAMMNDIEQPWFLTEFMKANTARRQQLRLSLTNARLVKQQMQENVVLEPIPGVNSKLLTSKVMQDNYLLDKKSLVNYFTDGNVFIQGKEIFMKYNISEVEQLCEEYLYHIRRSRRGEEENIDQAQRQKIYSIFLNTVTNIGKIIVFALEGKSILLFQKHDEFTLLPLEKYPALVVRCIDAIECIYRLCKERRVLDIGNQLLRNPQAIINLTNAMAFLSKLDPSKRLKPQNNIFIRICSIIRQIILDNQQQIFLLNSPQFIKQFVTCANLLLSDSQTTVLPFHFQNFLIQYITMLFQFSPQISSLNFQKIYSLKITQLNKSPLRRVMHRNHLDTRFGDESNENNEEITNLSNFINVFPDFLKYLQKQIMESAQKLENDIKNASFFEDNIPQNVQIFIRLFSSPEIEIDEQFNRSFEVLIKTNSAMLVKKLESVRWEGLKKRINVSEEQIAEEIRLIYSAVKNQDFLCNITAQDLCEKSTSTDAKLIQLINRLSYIIILLKIRDKNPKCSFIRQMLQIMLIMQKIQSKCLYRIVEHQAGYSDEKLEQIMKLYQQKSVEKGIVYFKLIDFLVELTQACWGVFISLQAEGLDQLAREYRVYFQAMRNIQDRNLLLKLIKKTFRNFRQLADRINYSLNCQLYRRNNKLILQVLSTILQLTKNKQAQFLQTAVIGTSYLNFIKKCRAKGTDPKVRFQEIIIPHIDSSTGELMEFLFLSANHPKTIFNNKVYFGSENGTKILRSILCHATRQVALGLHPQNLQIVHTFVNMIETRNIRSSHLSSAQTQTAFSHSQSDDMPLLSVEEKQKHFGQSHIIITQKIYEHRYNTKAIKELQKLYILSLRKMQERYKIANEENKLISKILKEIGEQSSQAHFNNQLFKNQSSWVDLILGTAVNVKIEQIISIRFAFNYLRAIQQMLNNRKEYEQLIPNTLHVLKMLIPKSNHKITKQFEQYSHTVLQIIIRIMECCKESEKIKDIKNSAYEIVQNLVKNNCSDFTPYVIRIVEYLSQTDINLGQILNSTIQKQYTFATIQSQIKGYFLRQSQNLVDQSQDRISTKLQSFISTFKYKYQDEIATFTNISGGFVKRSIKKQEKKDIIYLSYEKAKPFYLCEILKKEMIHIEPSNNTKIIINQIISSFSKKKRSIDGLLFTLRDLIFHNPLFSPYVMMHPVQTEGKTIQLIDYLLNLTLQQYHEQINNFFLFMCLDHSSIIELKDRSIFFAQYLSYRIIKAIMNSKVTEHSCMLTYGLTQLKRFSYLCKIKLNQDKGSLISYLINYLKASRRDFQYPHSLNNFIYLITWVVFKQDQIDNLKKCFIPKPNKDSERDYKLLNVSTIPSQLYELKRQQGGMIKREDVIAFTGNLITPFYSQIYDYTLMQRDYQSIDRKVFNYIEQDNELPPMIELFNPKIDQENIQYLTETTKSKMFRSAYGQTKGHANSMHSSNLQSLRKFYFKQQVPSERVGRNIFQRERGGARTIDMSEMQEMETRREMRNMRGGLFMARRGGRGMRRGGPRNLRQSPFAQEDFFVSSNSQQQSKSIEEEFKQSLSVLPSEQALVSQQSSNNFQQLKTGEEQLQNIISEIKQKINILGRQPFNIRVLQNKTRSQKKEYLEVLLIELDFDLQKEILTEQQFDVYCLSKSTQIERLDEQRRQYLDMAELRMFSLKLIKSGSGDTDEIIDALDENYQHLANFKRTFSREQSISSGQDDRQQFQGNSFFYESGSLSIRAFPDIQEYIIYQMLLSLYYSAPTNTYQQIIPFLSNKKYQHQIINVLLHLVKNPFRTKQFPSVVFEFSQEKKIWKKKTIDNTNEQMQTTKFFKRVLPIFQFVKNLCFYQDDAFLLERIHPDGLFGIIYEPRSEITEMNSYIPIYDILSYAFELNDRPSFDLFKGITHLPEDMTNKLLEQIKKEEKGVITAEEESIPRIQSLGMAYMHAQMRQNRQNRGKNIQYTYISSLLQNQQFCQKMRELYPFGQKYPSSKMMLQLVSSKVYTKEQLKEYTLTLMNAKPEKLNDLLLLNKLIDIFTDEQLKGAAWIKQNQQTIAKVLKFMIGSRKKIENEPIYRLVKNGGQNSYDVKKVLLVKELNDLKQNHQIRDYEQLQKSRVYAKRSKLFLSAFQDLKNLPESFWYSGFRIKFIDVNGIEQTGHGDGPNREWFTLVSKSMVNLDTGLFRLTYKNNYFFNRESYINPRHLQYFEFIGKLAALSLLRAQFIVSPSLSTILYKMILGDTITMQELCQQFKEQKKRLDGIYEMFKTPDNELQDIYLPFIYLDNKLLSSVNYDLKHVRSSGSNQVQVGETRVTLITSTENVIQGLQTQLQLSRLPNAVEVVRVAEYIQLKPGGSNIYLNAANKEEYLELTKKKIYQNLIQSVKKPAEAFIFGFKSLIKAKGLSMLNAKELKFLVEGTPNIDADDIEKYTRINEGVDQVSTAFFWECFKKLSHEDRGTLLMFWCGCDKMPVEGAKLLRLSISKSIKPYFIAHVCAMALDIPSAKDSEEMMAKINAVIELQRLGLAKMED